MRLPGDMSGEDLARQLRRCYGYQFVRQRGGHMTLTRTSGDESPSVTVPRHRALRVGTLGGIVADVAEDLDATQDEARRKLFGT